MENMVLTCSYMFFRSNFSGASSEDPINFLKQLCVGKMAMSSSQTWRKVMVWKRKSSNPQGTNILRYATGGFAWPNLSI